jgi:hypothetical protein
MRSWDSVHPSWRASTDPQGRMMRWTPPADGHRGATVEVATTRVAPARRQNLPLSCEGERPGDGTSVGPRQAEPEWVHELRARSHDRARLGPRTYRGGRSGPARVRGSHQGQRSISRTYRPNRWQQPRPPRQTLNKALARRKASMDGPSKDRVNGRSLTPSFNAPWGRAPAHRISRGRRTASWSPSRSGTGRWHPPAGSP